MVYRHNIIVKVTYILFWNNQCSFGWTSRNLPLILNFSKSCWRLPFPYAQKSRYIILYYYISIIATENKGCRDEAATVCAKKSTNTTGRQVHLLNMVFGISVTVFVISVIFENRLVLQTQCFVFGLVAGWVFIFQTRRSKVFYRVAVSSSNVTNLLNMK